LLLPGQSAPAQLPKPFPAAGLLPKQEIGAVDFLEQRPESDGRGVTVAIFDSGVDPGAEGLQTTSDGRPKVIDMIDGTGSGDVDTSALRVVSDRTVVGLTGRRLKLGEGWVAEGKKIHVGWKRAYDFFPPGLIGRLKRERSEKLVEEQRRIEAKLRRQILTAKESAKKELTTRLAQLSVSMKQVADPGPVFDCVCFIQDKRWRAVVDTNENGDLTDEQVLTNFRHEQEYGVFPGELNFGVNIYEHGQLLSIVVDTSPHGTHVAGIVAGFYPDQPDQNGLAPGAQIVSVKIGHPLMNGMETGPALERGVIAALRHRIDIINMSYGEPVEAPNQGRLIERISQLVEEHGVLFVSSAGNDGPALTTLGAPGGTASAVLGVGAYLSPAMLAAEYAAIETLAEAPYSFTSRGPAADGALGVDIFAPGGAIAPIPQWTQARSAQMNGTSMSSPNATGAAALLLSGLKQEKLAYSPAGIIRAMQNTARPLPNGDRFSEGPGLVQVGQAFDYLVHGASHPAERLRFDIRGGSSSSDRGAYLREPYETSRPLATSFMVRPVFAKTILGPERRALDLRCSLTPTADWVRCGEFLQLGATPRRFDVMIDPTKLSPGVHFAEIIGADSDHPKRGSLFRAPITVIIPEPHASATQMRRLDFTPGAVRRRFVAPPAGATQVKVELKLVGAKTPRTFMLHANQVVDSKSHEEVEAKRRFVLQPGEPKELSFRIAPERLLEVCLAQRRSSLGAAGVEYQITFGGIAADSVVHLQPDGAVRTEVAAGPRSESLRPSAQLTTHRQLLHPTSTTITPLSETRDRFPGAGVVYDMELTYAFSMKSAGSVTPRFPANDKLFYASPWGGYVWQIDDGQGMRVAFNDMDPAPVSLKQGDYTVHVWLRHDDPSKLERVKSSLLYLDRRLAKPIGVKVFDSLPHSAAEGRTFTSATLAPHQRQGLYLKVASASITSAAFAPGDLLLGELRLQAEGPGDVVQLIAAAPSGKIASPSKPPNKPLEETIFAYKIDELKQTPPESERVFDKRAARLLEQSPGNLQVLQAMLHRLDGVANRKQHLDEVVDAADAVIAQIDQNKLAQTLGRRGSHKAAESLRTILVDALYRKGRALGYMELPDVIEKHPIANPKEHAQAFEANFKVLQTWVDTTETDYFLLHIRRERRFKHWGSALALLQRRMPTAPTNYWYHKKRRDLFEELGWKQLHEYEARWLRIRFPKKEMEPEDG